MRRLLICAAVLGGFAASAHAAEQGIEGLKDPLPDSLTYKGVTIYGTIDVGYAYQTAGLPLGASFHPGLSWEANGTGLHPISTLVNNAASLSQIGVKVEEALGMGFTAIGKAGTAFDPVSAELADVCKSLVQAANGSKTANGDGPLCGQAFNTEVYAGLSNSAYGMLTAGRHASLTNAGAEGYDPNRGSLAFSLIGYAGGAVNGIGGPETAFWDNSVKYTYQYGPVTAAWEMQLDAVVTGKADLLEVVGAIAAEAEKLIGVLQQRRGSGAVNLEAVPAKPGPRKRRSRKVPAEKAAKNGTAAAKPSRRQPPSDKPKRTRKTKAARPEPAHAPAPASAARAPTVRMVAYAEKLAKAKKLPLPAGYSQDFQTCRRFLDQFG